MEDGKKNLYLIIYIINITDVLLMFAEYTKLQKLFVALQKPHRECLYDLSNPDYKNNNKKQIVWAEIAEEMAISSEYNIAFYYYYYY